MEIKANSGHSGDGKVTRFPFPPFECHRKCMGHIGGRAMVVDMLHRFYDVKHMRFEAIVIVVCSY